MLVQSCLRAGGEVPRRFAPNCLKQWGPFLTVSNSCDSVGLRRNGASMNLERIKTVAVLGAGTMGNGIAHVFARAGYEVILRDVEQRFLERALETIGKNLDREIKKGKLEEADKGTVSKRLKPVTDMSAIVPADFVVEAVPEKIE